MPQQVQHHAAAKIASVADLSVAINFIRLLLMHISLITAFPSFYFVLSFVHLHLEIMGLLMVSSPLATLISCKVMIFVLQI